MPAEQELPVMRVDTEESLSPSVGVMAAKAGTQESYPSYWKADWPAKDNPIDAVLHDMPHASSTIEWWYVFALGTDSRCAFSLVRVRGRPHLPQLLTVDPQVCQLPPRECRGQGDFSVCLFLSQGKRLR